MFKIISYYQRDNVLINTLWNYTLDIRFDNGLDKEAILLNFEGKNTFRENF